MDLKKVALLVAIIILTVCLSSAFAVDKLFIAGSQASINGAKDFFTTLSNESIPLAIITEQFDKVKKETCLIVLGGTKGAGTVEDFVKQILTREELESGNQVEGKMFVKENVFVPGQTIIVFTGSDETAAAGARKSSRKNWWPYLVKWFELDTSLPMAY
jgi:hypothetical protein